MVKVDLITGFLGSGKTTFIRKYAKYLMDEGNNIGILENDYGAVNVDMMLLQDLMGDNCELEMISGGCDKDCHRRRFKTKLIAMGMCGYDRVIVEPSGIFDVDEFFDILHEETVVLLSHKKPDGHINVKVEFGEGEGKVPLDNIAKRAEEYKPKERVTYKMIKEYIEAKYGFKVHTAYIAEVKRDLGLPMYDAPNAVEELKQPRKHPTAEKVEAIKDALKHFEVI